jgi:glycosyltransferase involved in cell wall biosynthesis
MRPRPSPDGAIPVIYVCIPTHNESDTIGVLLWKTRNVLGEFGRDYRLLVHDDASTDDTPEVLQRYRRSLPLTILRSEERVGYARSVEKLLRHAIEDAAYPKRDCAVVIQGDFTESPADIVTLVKVLEGGADIVAGATPADASPPSREMRFARWAARTFLAHVLRGAPVSDPLSGLRAYRMIVLRKGFRDLPADVPLVRSEGWAANAELLGRLAPHARRISETELQPRYDLQTRPSRFRPVRTLLSLARLPRTLWSAPGPEAA